MGGSVPSMTCRVDSGTNGHFQARGCGRGRRVTGNQSQDEWAQYWGAAGGASGHPAGPAGPGY